MALPIGWQSFPPRLDSAFAMQVAGWLLTASTALFGAPFWFDLLQRTVQMRGTGEKPETRRKLNSQTRGRWASTSTLDTDMCGTRSGHSSSGPNQRASDNLVRSRCGSRRPGNRR